jgi:hypothetical protein
MDKMRTPYVLETPEYWTDEHVNWETQNRKNQWITVYEGNVRGRVIGENLNIM